MERIYYRYELWECYKNGMYDLSYQNEADLINSAISLLTNSGQFLQVGFHVIDNWKITCDVHLSNKSANHQAFIGQAACSYKYQVPEILTKRAWGMLTQTQREEANQVADQVITKYFNRNEKENRQLSIGLEC